ncbi:MAG TPA: M23 family metallopeptidase [Patescibacteria group bacterium]|nr:M23 family metallopeptidase [Patescibacteria group bacterium]
MSEHHHQGEAQFLEGLVPTANSYIRPFPADTEIKGIEYEGPSHSGPYRGAVDFLVPTETPVLMPQTGRVIEVVDSHTRYGPTEEFATDLNYVTLMHANGEFSQVAHLKQGSAIVQVGDIVEQGQRIATSGNSGWQTEPHIHFYVFTTFSAIENGGLVRKFEGRRIRFE